MIELWSLPVDLRSESELGLLVPLMGSWSSWSFGLVLSQAL